jgi:sec-independent protein translocase protein TatA
MRGWACAKITKASAPKANRKAPTANGSRVGGSSACVVPVVPHSMAAKITAATPNACFCATASPPYFAQTAGRCLPLTALSGRNLPVSRRFRTQISTSRRFGASMYRARPLDNWFDSDGVLTNPDKGRDNMLNNIGLPGLLLIAVVVLVLFGRGKISSLMGEVGKGITAFKKGVKDGSEEIADQSAAEAKDVTPATEKDKA